MIIRSLIRTEFDVTTPYTAADKVRNIIFQKGVVVVLDKEDFAGVLTSNDLLLKPHNLVIDCISPRPFVSPTHSLLEVLNIMNESSTNVLPVFENETFVGIILYKAVMECIAKIVDEQRIILQSIAHDLKSPISNILGLSALLRENTTEKEKLELVGFTEQACNYATEIINDLLIMPQLEGDQNEMQEYELVNINWFLKECVDTVLFPATSKKIELISNISGVDFFFPIHKSKFKRAIHNLLSNAIKFTPPKGKITISSSHREKSILISIKDSGVGIPKSAQPLVFNKFTKAKRTGTDGEKSIGLGLFITKQIIEQHNGQLWFESNDPVGTIFFIKLTSQN